MCESIGHRPLWGHCPALSLNFNRNLLRQGTGTADHLTLSRLFAKTLNIPREINENEWETKNLCIVSINTIISNSYSFGKDR